MHYPTNPTCEILQTPYDAFTVEELKVMTSSMGDEGPEGDFVRERNGITHFIVDRPPADTKQKRGLIILVPGLGNNVKDYQELSNELVGKGYSTLRYDYYGHGYSKYGFDTGVPITKKKSVGGRPIPYTSDLFVDQLEDILESVLRQDEENGKEMGRKWAESSNPFNGDDSIAAIVGHGSGGAVAIACNERWAERRPVRRRNERGAISKVILVAPTIYSDESLSAKVWDVLLPSCGYRCLAKTSTPAVSAFRNWHERNVERGFGCSPGNKDMLKSRPWEEKRDRDRCLLGEVEQVPKHPYFERSLLGIYEHHLSSNMRANYRGKFLNMLSNRIFDVLVIWGDLDVVVSYEENVEEVWDWETHKENLRLQVMNDYGHELFHEGGSADVANVILSHLKPRIRV